MHFQKIYILWIMRLLLGSIDPESTRTIILIWFEIVTIHFLLFKITSKHYLSHTNFEVSSTRLKVHRQTRQLSQNMKNDVWNMSSSSTIRMCHLRLRMWSFKIGISCTHFLVNRHMDMCVIWLWRVSCVQNWLMQKNAACGVLCRVLAAGNQTKLHYIVRVWRKSHLPVNSK